MVPEATHDNAVGLVLTGGGARAAYQVGVLQAIDAIRQDCGASMCSPFRIFAGTSAGAINASALACRGDNFSDAVAELARVWGSFHAEQVYRAGSLAVIRTGAPWLTMMSLGWLVTRWTRVKPRSLLDNSPLEALLSEMIRWDRLPKLMHRGIVDALAITASSYTSGMHVTFYESERDIAPWSRSQRFAIRARLGPEHLLASSAIPFVFPSVALDCGEQAEWFGDGAMRQAAPISPAVHLGASRVLVVGAGRMHEPPGRVLPPSGYPSVAQVAGHALSNIFLDALAVDIERLQRINATVSLLDAAARLRTSLRPIDALVIAPSQRLDDLAAQHVHNLPRTIRQLLGAVGVSGQANDVRGAALASYLLFEAPYTQALMALGMSDTLARRADVIRFFGWTVASGSVLPS
jgi:NTE family protein